MVVSRWSGWCRRVVPARASDGDAQTSPKLGVCCCISPLDRASVFDENLAGIRHSKLVVVRVFLVVRVIRVIRVLRVLRVLRGAWSRIRQRRSRITQIAIGTEKYRKIVN